MKYFKDFKKPTVEEIERLKADREEADSLSHDEIKYRLEKASDGSHVHTVNKARFHMDYMLDNDKERFKFGKGFDRLRELRFNIFLAIKYGAWTELNEWMKGMY